MMRVIRIIHLAILLTLIMPLMLTSGTGCGGGSGGGIDWSSYPYPKVYYVIRQQVETSREIITIASTEKVDQIKRPLGLGSLIGTAIDVAAPGTVFVVVEVSVTNVGQSSSFSISYKDFSMKDAQGRVWPCLKYTGYHPYPSQKLAPGQSASGYVYFNPLETSTGLELYHVLKVSPPVLGVWQLPY